MVFGLIALFDLLVLVIIIVSILLGIYGNAPKQEEGEGANGAKTAAEASAVENDLGKGTKFDDIPEVPQFQDLYNEHIPEISSSFEQSSFHTKRIVD